MPLQRLARRDDGHEPVGALPASADPGRHAARFAELIELGVYEIHQLHQIGRNQRAFIEGFGARVLPVLRS